MRYPLALKPVPTIADDASLGIQLQDDIIDIPDECPPCADAES